MTSDLVVTSGNFQLPTGFSQHVASVMQHASSNHQVLLRQLDELMQMALQFEVLTSFQFPHAYQETEGKEVAAIRGMPQGSEPLLSHVLAQQHYHTEAAKQTEDQDNSLQKHGPSGISSRVSTSSLPSLCIDSDALYDEQPTEQLIPHPLAPFQAPGSNIDTSAYQEHGVSHRSQCSTQPCAPHQSEGPRSRHKTRTSFSVPRGPQESPGSSDSAELTGILPSSSSNASSQSNPMERLSHSSRNSGSSLKERLSNCRNSRIKDLRDMKTNSLFRMHGIQAECSASSSSSQAWDNRLVRSAQPPARHRRPMPLMPALSSSNLPGTLHQPVQAENLKDSAVNKESSTATAQEEEDRNSLEKMSASSVSLEDITGPGENEDVHASTDKFYSSSLMPFRPSKMNAMRSSLELQLVEKMTADPELVNVQRVPYIGRRFYVLCRAPRILLHLFGIAPWGAGLFSMAYFYLSPLVLAFLCALSLNKAVQQKLTVMETISGESHTLGCLLALLSFRKHGAHKCVASARSLLDQHATICGFPVEWHWKSFQQWLVIMLGGTVMLVAKLWFILDPACRSSRGDAQGDIEMLCDFMSLVLSTGYFTAIMYCQVLVSSGLSVAVDTSCAELAAEKDLALALSKWELLQAVLRQVAYSTEGCFCGLGLTLVMGFVCTLLQLMQGHESMVAESQDDRCLGLWYGWVVPRWMLMLYVFHQAAHVTDLCSQAPSLINSWSFCTDRQQRYDRQHAVQYIIHSEAGYYIGGVRITSQMKMKITYLVCVVTATVVSQKSAVTSS